MPRNAPHTCSAGVGICDVCALIARKLTEVEAVPGSLERLLARGTSAGGVTAIYQTWKHTSPTPSIIQKRGMSSRSRRTAYRHIVKRRKITSIAMAHHTWSTRYIQLKPEPRTCALRSGYPSCAASPSLTMPRAASIFNITRRLG